MRESLHLVGDEGLEDAIERAFDVRLTEGEWSDMVRVGDIYAALMTRFAEAPGVCVTSMTFYRLRRALRLMGASGRIGADTILPEFLTRRTRLKFHALAARSGLRLPSIAGGPWMTGCLVLALPAVALLIFGRTSHAAWPVWASAAVVAMAFMFLRMDQGRVPASLATVGDLARATAPLNFGRLVRQGARVDEAGVWITLRDVIGDNMDIPPSEIGRETLICTPRKRACA